MKKQLISWSTVTDHLEPILNIFFIVVSIPMIVVPVISGYRSGWHYIIEWGGLLLLLFKANIYFIEKPLYFFFMFLFFILLFLFLISDGFGLGLFGVLGEDIAFTFGFFCLAGIFASIIGYFMKK